MKVWVVMVGDCEGSSLVCVCASKEVAERQLLRKRNELIKEWQEGDDYIRKTMAGYIDDRYSRMITALSSDDYENWNNYPHDCPYILEQEIIEKENEP